MKFIFKFGYPQILRTTMHMILGLFTCFAPQIWGYSPLGQFAREKLLIFEAIL
jgi:hypothetical protein